MEDSKLLYTVAESVGSLGLGRTKLYEEMNAGRLNFVKAGDRRLVPHEALVAYVELLKAEMNQHDELA